MAGGRPIILHCLDGLGVGGAERQLVLLLRHVPPETFAQALCRLGPRRELEDEVAALGVTVFDLSRGRRQSPAAALRLLRLVRRLRPAMLHADHDFAKLCAGLVGWLLRVPVLATMGNTLPSEVGNTLRLEVGNTLPPDAATMRPTGTSANRTPQTTLRGRVVSPLLRRVLRAVEAVVTGRMITHYMAVGEAVRADLIAAGVPDDRISVVRRGINLAEFHPDPPERLYALRAELGLVDAGAVLINVARLDEQKGQETLLLAMPRITAAHPTVRLLLVGDGPLGTQYRRMAADLGVEAHVRFLGVRSDVRLLLQLADLFVFPSRREGAAGALLEAMAMARACVASDIPELAEILDRGTGRLVPPDRPDLLADAVLTLLDDPATRAAMGHAAREVVTDRFDIRRNALEFAALCGRLVGSHPAPQPAGGVA